MLNNWQDKPVLKPEIPPSDRLEIRLAIQQELAYKRAVARGVVEEELYSMRVRIVSIFIAISIALVVPSLFAQVSSLVVSPDTTSAASTTVMDVRLGLRRYFTSGLNDRRCDIGPSQLGFGATFVSQALVPCFPVFSFGRSALLPSSSPPTPSRFRESIPMRPTRTSTCSSPSASCFGKIAHYQTQTNLPRQIQLGGKITF